MHFTMYLVLYFPLSWVFQAFLAHFSSNQRILYHLAHYQGYSVLKDTDIIKNVIKVQAVLKEFKTDILDIVFA